MNSIAPPDPVIRSIPLSQLELAPENVRKTPAGAAALDQLKASIAAHGLLENLVVRSEGPGPDGAGRYAVVAGGRRLEALAALRDDGALDKDHPVACLMAGNRAVSRELSLAENSVRAAMHPADQVQAFGALAGAGSGVAAIAARFGVSERTVEQRLRLGNAAPELLDAYRADEIDLDVLKAFAVTTDRARQMAVWERVSGQGYRPSGWQIKRMLTEDRVPAAAAAALFVGAETYEAAGGRLDRDLFADDDEWGIWFEDPDLLDRLAMERLQAAADELAADWKWTEARIDMDWSATARFGRVRPRPGEPTAEETAESERLAARHDELVNMDEQDWTEELAGEADAIEERIAGIEAAVEARAVYRPGDMAIAGCIATIGHGGRLQLLQGLVRPEDVPAPGQGDANASASDDGGDDGGEADTGVSGVEAPTVSGPSMPPARPDPAAEARKEAGIGIGLSDDLRSIRTALVKAHLADDFGAAFDLMLFQMARSVFAPGYHDHALDIAVRETPDRPQLRVNDDAFAAMSPGEAMLADRSRLRLDWLAVEDPGEAFAALRALPDPEKQALFAACVARTVKGQLSFEHSARPELEATIARLSIDFAAHVRPGADMFWSRIPKARILDIARDTLGAEWTSGHGKDKKAVLAAAMERAFAAGGNPPPGVTAETHAAAMAWTPPGFRPFDKAAAGDADSSRDTGGAVPAGEPDAPSGDDPDPAARAEPTSDSSSAGADAPDNLAGGDGPAAAHRPEGKDTSDPTNGAGGDGNDSPEPSIFETIDALNAVPTGDGNPRAVVRTVGFDTDREAGDPSGIPGPANGHAAGSAADPFDIPEFLQRH